MFLAAFEQPELILVVAPAEPDSQGSMWRLRINPVAIPIRTPLTKDVPVGCATSGTVVFVHAIDYCVALQAATAFIGTIANQLKEGDNNRCGKRNMRTI